MAIALAHGGKTREELAKELASIDGGGESDDTSGQKSPLPKLAKSTNFFVSLWRQSFLYLCVIEYLSSRLKLRHQKASC